MLSFTRLENLISFADDIYNMPIISETITKIIGEFHDTYDSYKWAVESFAMLVKHGNICYLL